MPPPHPGQDFLVVSCPRLVLRGRPPTRLGPPLTSLVPSSKGQKRREEPPPSAAGKRRRGTRGVSASAGWPASPRSLRPGLPTPPSATWPRRRAHPFLQLLVRGRLFGLVEVDVEDARHGLGDDACGTAAFAAKSRERPGED